MEDIELRQILNLILDKVSSIDTRLATVETRLTAVEDRLTAVEARLTTVETNVAKLQVDVANLQTSVSTLETNVAKLQVDVTNLQTSVSTLETNVTNLQADVTDIKLVQENVTNKHLQILSEGHQLLSEKFSQIDKASADIEELKGGMAVIEMTTAHNWSSISALKMAR